MATKNLELYYMHRPVADLAALKAIDTTNIVDGLTVEILSMGTFALYRSSTETPDDRNIVQPVTGSGRWKRLDMAGFKIDGTGKIDSSILPSANGVTGTTNQIDVTFGSGNYQVGFVATPVMPNGTTATTQSQGDNSTKLSTTAYVDTAITNVTVGETHKAWVDQTLGNDSTGTWGKMAKPFATYNAAATAAVTPTYDNPYLVHYSPGKHIDASLSLRPFVYLSGDATQSTVIVPASATVTAHSSFSLEDARSGFQNVSFGTGGSLVSVNLDMTSIGGAFGSAFDFRNCWFLGTFALKSRGNFQDEADCWNCTFYGNVNIDGGTFITEGCLTAADLIITGTTYDAHVSILSSNIFNITIHGNVVGVSNTLDLRFSSINGTLTIDGPHCTVVTDTDSISRCTVVYSNGATSAQLTIKALPNGTRATTQLAGDNSTKVATTAYVDSAIGGGNLWSDATTYLKTVNPRDVRLDTSKRYAFKVAASAYANFNGSLNLNYGGGSLNYLAQGATSIVGGWLILGRDNGAYVTYDAVGNFDSPQQGTIKIKYRPAYSGYPNNDSTIWSQGYADGSERNLFTLYHTWRVPTPHIHLIMNDDTGAVIFDEAVGVWSPVAGTSYEIEVDYDITNGATRVFIDGIQLGSTITATGTRGDITLFRLGRGVNNLLVISNGDVDDLIAYNTVQHTSNYTPGYGLYGNTTYQENYFGINADPSFYAGDFPSVMNVIKALPGQSAVTMHDIPNGARAGMLAWTGGLPDTASYFHFNSYNGKWELGIYDTPVFDCNSDLFEHYNGIIESIDEETGASYNVGNYIIPHSLVALTSIANNQNLNMPPVSSRQTLTVNNPNPSGYTKKAVAKSGEKFKINGVLYDDIVIPSSSSVTFYSNGTYWFIK